MLIGATADDPGSIRTLGLLGSTIVALGGLTAGALPHRMTGPQSPATIGLLTVYFGLTFLVVAWWRLGRSVHGERPPGVGNLLGTLALWAAPLALGAPLFSRDGYSYLAQGAMVEHGLDVYQAGPALLGGPVAAEVPGIWQHTPTPYGPVFLMLAVAVAWLAGTTLVLGILGLRLIAVGAVAAIAVLLPRLARRCAVEPATALWLGALNPLVLLHLIAGAHNDAVMLALLVGGLTVSYAPAVRDDTPPRRPAGNRWSAINWRLPAAAALVTLAALVKAPAATGLAAVAAVAADRLTGRARLLRAALGTVVTALVTTVVVTTVAGTGYGWIGALRTPVSPQNWSVSALLGRFTERALTAAGLGGAHLAVPAWRWLGALAVLAVSVVAWLQRERLGPGYALGLGLGALAVFGPATRPWYLLWGLVPLAATAPPGRVRRYAALGCAGLAFVVLPSGYAPTLVELELAGLGVLLAGAALRSTAPAPWLAARPGTDP